MLWTTVQWAINAAAQGNRKTVHKMIFQQLNKMEKLTSCISMSKIWDADRVAQTDRQTDRQLPVWGAPGQNFPALLRVSHTVNGLLGVLAFCNGGDLEQKAVGYWLGLPVRLRFLPRLTTAASVWVRLCVSTCTVWTCGDWITDGCAAWMTPWTCTVCPLGSCTSVTVGPVAEAWPVARVT